MSKDFGCKLCPRECNVSRNDGERGYCGTDNKVIAARAALHMWEEPCISGLAGSGAVFFSGCQMGCVYCQNIHISRAKTGKIITIERLSDIFFELEEQGALNINLVTPSHFIPQIVQAIELAKKRGLTLPFVFNSGGYDKAESIRLLDGLIDIYMPDFKYFDGTLAARYSNTPDYFEYASASLKEMVRQIFIGSGDDRGNIFYDELTGKRLDSMDESENAVMRRGIIVRHLLLPGGLEDSKKVVRYLHEAYKEKIYISLMNQYTPMAELDASRFPELTRKVTGEEYDELVDYAIELGVENGFIQEGETAKESFIPPFDLEGV